MASRQIYLSRNIFDVAVSGVADGEVLTWDNATEKWIPGTGGGGHIIQDEGVSLTQRTKLNFVGAGVGVTDDVGNDASIVTISGGGGGGHTIQDEGVSLTQRTKLNFVGGGVAVTDDSGNDASIVTISVEAIASGILSQEVYETLTAQVVSGISHFTLSDEVYQNNLRVYYNGIRQQSNHYIVDIDNLGFTTDFVVQVGDEIFVDYEITTTGIGNNILRDYFTNLLDVPNSYTGKANQFVTVNDVESALDFTDPGLISLANEVMNFPSLESANDTQPEWWDESSGNATLTEVDIVGESITETFERGLKVVTIANNEYAYQRYTYADQQRLKSGRVVSCAIAVWSVGGVTARVRLQSSVGSLAVESTTAAAWTIIKLENITIDGTYIDLRFEVDTGTAYFVPLGLHIGPIAFQLKPRGLQWVNKDTPVNIKTLTGLADEATWTDIDVTANSSNLAFKVQITIDILHTNATGWDVFISRNGSAAAADITTRKAALSNTANTERSHNTFLQLMDDLQIFEYYLDRWTGSSTLAEGQIILNAYEEWE